MTLLLASVLPTAIFAADQDTAVPQVTRLSLRQAIDLALAPTAASLQPAQARVNQAKGRVAADRIPTSLLVEADLSEQVLRVDLRALGIDIPQFSNLISNVGLPGSEGPFTLTAPQIRASKTLIDKAAKERLAAARKGIEEATSAVREAREKTAAETARAYLDAVRAVELFKLTGRGLAMARTMEAYAEERRKQSLGTESDIRRAKSNVSAELQKVSAARLDESRAVLRLAYLLGSSFGATLELTDPLTSHSTGLTLEEAIAEALRDNPRLASLHLHDQTLKLEDSAVGKSWIPVLSASGIAGLSVVAPDLSGVNTATETYIYEAGITLKFPLLDGHTRALEHAKLSGEMHQQQALERDLRRQIELDVRLAFAGVTEANTQLALAEESYRYAEQEVEEFRANRAAGNVSGLELQQAETQQSIAAGNRVVALHGQAQARLALAEAMGTVESLQW